MAAIKKYNGSTFIDAAIRKYSTASEIIVPPTTIYTDGTAITSYTIKGNTVQNGTPTPSNPVDVSGVGVRTENLFDYTTMSSGLTGYYLDSSGNEVSNNTWNITDYIPCDGQTFTLGKIGGNAPAICLYDNNKSYIAGQAYNTGAASIKSDITVAATQTAKYIRFSYLNTQGGSAADDLSTIMLNSGSTAKPYEPWGYKIPILTAQGSAVNYLGSVSSNRQIKKLVLTGGVDETWNNAGDGTMYRSDISDYLKEAIVTSVCTHYPCNANVPSSTAAQYGVSFITSSSYNRLYIKDTLYSTATDFKNWLATEYANGTPVTVWYVLATAETGTVNEPLMKIGDYADSISNATAIPTTEGANNITVDTTVQPSEFTATWTGWHDSSVKEYDGTNWS